MKHSLTLLILSIVLLQASLLNAQPATAPSISAPPATRPALLELLLPEDASISLDGRDLEKQRRITIDTLAPGQTQRVALKAKFANGVEQDLLVDLEEGQTIPVPFPPPQPDKAVAIALRAVDPILCIALSADQRHLVIGMDSGAIVEWDLSTGNPGRAFSLHRSSVQSLAFSADGKFLLSGSADNTAALWDFATGKSIQTFKGHTDQVMSAVFSPDGSRVLTGSMDKTAIIWNAGTGEKIQTIVGHTDQIFGVAFSLDGKIVATAALDKTGALWDAQTGKLLFVLRGHPDGVSSVAFSPDGKTVATGSFDNSAIFWDIATGKRLKQTGKHEIDIYGVTYTPDGRKLLTAARDEVVMMWDATSGKALRTFLGHNSDVGGAVVTRDSRLMFSCSRDGMVKLWDMATGMELASLLVDPTRKNWAVVAPDGLFDASEAGRQTTGFRFAKATGGSLDQFFNERFHPGLLTEIMHEKRPLAKLPLGHAPPPTVKIISPKPRSVPTTQSIDVTVEVTAQTAGAVSSVRLLNNHTPVAMQRIDSTAPDNKPLQVVFKNVQLAAGANQFRVVASNSDQSWDSAPAEVELTFAPARRAKGRLYVLTVGTDRALADLMQARAARLYDRIDVVHLSDSDATKSLIEDTLADLADLTGAGDSLVVIMSGFGVMTGDRIQFLPPGGTGAKEGLRIEQLAASLASAHALNRALVLDLAAANPEDAGNATILRASLERLSRDTNIHAVVSIAPQRDRTGSLSKALISRAAEAPEPMDWFAQSAALVGGQSSSQISGFPVLAPAKP